MLIARMSAAALIGLGILGAGTLGGCASRSEGRLDNTVLVIGSVPQDLARGRFCEGTYTCTAAGSVFAVGTVSQIGFWGGVCPNNATVGDGSLWALTPGSCRCP